MIKGKIDLLTDEENVIPQELISTLQMPTSVKSKKVKTGREAEVNTVLTTQLNLVQTEIAKRD